MCESYNQDALFKRLFLDHYNSMPRPWRTLHDCTDLHFFNGEAEVIRGGNFFTTLFAMILRLPPSSQVSVQLRLEKAGEGEIWSRRFGDSHFETYLYLDSSRNNKQASSDQSEFYLIEKYGPISFGIQLKQQIDCVEWSIDKWWFWGVPLPAVFAPLSETKEFIDEEGRYAFDIDLSLPFFGRLIAYRGWLETE